MVTSLIHHEAIKTTVPKAKEVRRLAEKLVTLGKKGRMPIVVYNIYVYIYLCKNSSEIINRIIC